MHINKLNEKLIKKFPELANGYISEESTEGTAVEKSLGSMNLLQSEVNENQMAIDICVAGLDLSTMTTTVNRDNSVTLICDGRIDPEFTHIHRVFGGPLNKRIKIAKEYKILFALLKLEDSVLRILLEKDTRCYADDGSYELEVKVFDD